MSNTAESLGIAEKKSRRPVTIPMEVVTGEQLPPVLTQTSLSHVTPPKDFATILKAARVMVNDVYALPPKALSFVSGEETFTYGTLGNFSLVTGKAKSKKTFLMCLVLAACTGRATIQNTIKCELPGGKIRVVLFDTEQSKYHVWKKLQAIATLCGLTDMINIEVYSLREYNPAERCDLINYLLVEGNGEKNIGLVVIDGIRDLVRDINSCDEATDIVSKLMRWTTSAYCHIVTVLHQNKNDTNARGHVGAELVNKSETVISVTVTKEDKNISIVEPEDLRDKHFPGFAYKINDIGLPEILIDYTLANGAGEKGAPKFNAFNIQPATHHGVLKKAYINAAEFSRPELLSELTVSMGAFGYQIGRNAIGDLVTYYAKMGWLKNESTTGKKARWRYYPDPV